ncbi:MAG: gamma-butyrobetaine hydroxylase-like domain-containing protein [Alphaproteobacteria bacterium]
MKQQLNVKDIKLNSETKQVAITFDNNQTFHYPAEFLRVYSPSAEVRGHGMEPPKLIYGRKHIGIMNIEVVGNYAIRISFDDMHDSGIYSWEYLYDLGENFDAYWDMYLKRLEKENKSRQP